jgi:hypothetical protein
MKHSTEPRSRPRPLRAALLVAAAVAVSAATPARAQTGEFDPGQYFIEGVRALCPEVTTIVRNRTDTLIEAPDPYTIVINAGGFSALPPGIRLFIYYQTCAFMFYREATQADAMAVGEGVEALWLSASDVETMCSTTLLVDAGWTGAPDAARCEAIFQAMRGALL